MADEPMREQDMETNVPIKGEAGSLSFLEHDKNGDEGAEEENVSWSIAYLSKSKDTIAKFDAKNENDLPNLSKNSSSKKWTSPNGKYYATRNGLFNKRNELLIPYNETRYPYKVDIVTIGFSTDNRFFFLVDKIYLLDPEMILSRFNNKEISGSIAQLDSNTYHLYLIKDPQPAKAY